MTPPSTDATAATEARSARRRFLRFSTRTLLIALTLVCLWLGWRTSQIRTQQRQLCRRLVDTILVARHWEAFGETGDLRHEIRTLATELTTADIQFKILRLDGTFGDGGPADTFESELLSEWKRSPGAAVDEFAERNPTFAGPYVYYRPVRSEQICFQCHRSDFAPDSLQSDWQPPSGALMGIVKIELVD